jgi:hypothetical protein
MIPLPIIDILFTPIFFYATGFGTELFDVWGALGGGVLRHWNQGERIKAKG